MELGLAPHFFNLSMELKNLGVKQTVIAGKTDAKTVNGIPVHQFTSKHPFELIRSGSAVYEKFKELEQNFDLIHYHNPAYFLLSHYKKKLNTPLIQTIHGSPTRVKRNIFFEKNLALIKQSIYFVLFTSFALKRVDATIVVASEEKRFLQEKWNVPEEKVFFIPTAVDTTLFKPIKTKKDIDLLFAGRFSPKKRVEDIVQAAAEIVKSKPNLKVALVGGKPQDFSYNRIVSLIKNFNLQKNIQIIPPVDFVKLRSYYNRSKIFVLPSIEEGLPKVLLEAMACEIPAVVSNICGNLDAVKENYNGLFVEPLKVKQLVEKINYLLDSPQERKRLGKNGRKKAVKEFTWKIVAKKNKEVYEKVCRR
jgi:glycosyltransferase involved in cell wall biosynthesis